MLELSPVEEWTLRALRCLFRPLLVRIVLWFFVALFIYWLIQRVNTVNTTPGVHRVSLGTESGSCNTLTLLDPQKLRETLKTFALPNKPGSKGDRYRTEALCRSLLESMLGMPLPKVRPKWLVNPSTKRSLELDMYNAEHHIAFEYDGAQHDVYTPHVHNNGSFQVSPVIGQTEGRAVPGRQGHPHSHPMVRGVVSQRDTHRTVFGAAAPESPDSVPVRADAWGAIDFFFIFALGGPHHPR